MRTLIRDGKGKTIGNLVRISKDRTNVCGPSLEPLGFVWNGKTYDRQGRIVSMNEVPGILLGK